MYFGCVLQWRKYFPRKNEINNKSLKNEKDNKSFLHLLKIRFPIKTIKMF